MKTALLITLWAWLVIIVAIQVCVPIINRAQADVQHKYAPALEVME